MKRLSLGLAILVGLLIGITSTHYTLQAQGIGPYVALTAVASGQSCPTPNYTGSQLQGVICTDGQSFFWSTAQNPAPQVLAQGPPGPIGPVGATGPAGATGATGPPGPASSFTSMNCTTGSSGNAGLSGSNCTEQ